ncbi:TolC family protein [Roseovarius ramblicola]|uniref:TolC family protein n=1 Tax=Roseovarius ramblicola TaxID=2022336 RepID=A0ABV5HY63_9RHOB
MTLTESFRLGARGLIPALAACLAFAPGLVRPAAAESLADAVRAAVTTNPTGRAANADVKASALELLQLRGEYQPRLFLRGEAGAERFDDPERLTPSDNEDTKFNREISLTAELTLFDGYRRANLVYRNASRLDESIFGLLDASETMALNAVEAYVDLARHSRLLNVANRNIARHRDIGRQVDELVDGGKLPVSDRFEVQERLLAARLSRLEVQRAMADTAARYRAVIGHDPGGTEPVPAVGDLPMTKKDMVLHSLRNSFRLKGAGQRIAQTRFRQGITTADEKPQVTLQAGVRAGEDVAGSAGAETDAFVGLRLDWELFAGGRDARRRALQQRTLQAEEERREVVRDVREMAERSWNAYHTSIERTVLLDRRVSAARKTSAQYQDQFLAGTRSLLDVLDAERTYFNVLFENVSAEASFTFNQYRILAAQSRLAAHFDVEPADVPLEPDFAARAQQAPRATGIFKTEIRALR